MDIKEAIEFFGKTGIKKVILDSDTANEADDQFAIAYAASCEGIDLLGVCTEPFLNDRCSDISESQKMSFAEAKKVISLGGFDVKCFTGADAVMKAPDEAVVSDASRFIVDTVRACDETVVLACIGMGTNIAAALLEAPDIAEKIIILWQAGNFSPEKQMPEGNEFNLSGDIFAARVIFGSAAPLVMCPGWNVASKLRVSLGEMTKRFAKNSLSEYLINQLAFYMNGYAPEKEKIIWDIGVVGILSENAAVMKIYEKPSIADDGSFEGGEGVFAVCVDIDAGAVCSDMLRCLGE